MQDVRRIFIPMMRRPEEEQGTRRRRVVKDVFQRRIPKLEITIIGVDALVLLHFDTMVEGGVVGAQVELD